MSEAGKCDNLGSLLHAGAVVHMLGNPACDRCTCRRFMHGDASCMHIGIGGTSACSSVCFRPVRLTLYVAKERFYFATPTSEQTALHASTCHLAIRGRACGCELAWLRAEDEPRSIVARVWGMPVGTARSRPAASTVIELRAGTCDM